MISLSDDESPLTWADDEVGAVRCSAVGWWARLDGDAGGDGLLSGEKKAPLTVDGRLVVMSTDSIERLR